MKVSSISIKNVLGVQERSVECGQVTAFSGANATGKTSLLEAIKATLGRGNLAKLARIGADSPPETILVLDDGAYRVERKGGKTKVKRRVGDSAAYEDVNQPQAFLSKLFDAQLSNPVLFLEAKPKDRVELLLGALPIEVSWPELRAQIGVWPAGMEADALDGVHPLEGLALLRQALYDERTGVNRSAKDKSSSAYELAKTVPAKLPDDPEAAIEAAQEALAKTHAAAAEAKGERETEEERISGAFKAQAAKRRTKLAEAQAAVKAEADRKIAEIQAEAVKEVGALTAQADDEIEVWKADAQKELDAIQRATSEKLVVIGVHTEAAAAELATLRELSKSATRAHEAKKTADRFEAEAEALKVQSETLTTGIETLDSYRRSLAENLPIEGVEVRDREIFVDDVPYDQVNTQRKVELAVQIATLRAKGLDLPILFVDGAEALDSDHFAALVKALDESEVQAFLARVTNEPLSVEVS